MLSSSPALLFCLVLPLREIARLSGGRYFRARDTEELAQIYRLLDELEPVAKDTQDLRPIKALFIWPLALALLLAGFMALQRIRVLR